MLFVYWDNAAPEIDFVTELVGLMLVVGSFGELVFEELVDLRRPSI